jgi:outer membrane murein-binding lipoprotein Lpp
LIFADPEVGWALEFHEKMSFTVDGGNRWNSRAFRFPATPREWSFPRRDRAYVVGEHGMVFRYSVVPTAQRVSASSVAAPVMPSFGSPLETQVPEIATFVQDLTTVVEQLPDSATAAAAAPPVAASPDPAGGFTQDAAPPSLFVTACCGKSVNRLNVVLGMVGQSLPQFVARFKNTNLLIAGLRMLTTMPSQLSDIRGALRDFKSATDKEAARAALARLGTATSSFRQSTQAALQKEGTP